MKLRSLLVSVLVASPLLVSGCKGSPEAPNPHAQSIVEATAKEHPDVVRLTLHMVPPGGGDCCAVASTSDEKLGKPSDQEDLQAMRTGQVVVLEEPGALDVTVPIMQKVAAVGVTLKSGAGTNRDALVQQAQQIAMAIEKAMVIK